MFVDLLKHKIQLQININMKSTRDYPGQPSFIDKSQSLFHFIYSVFIIYSFLTQHNWTCMLLFSAALLHIQTVTHILTWEHPSNVVDWADHWGFTLTVADEERVWQLTFTVATVFSTGVEFKLTSVRLYSRLFNLWNNAALYDLFNKWKFILDLGNSKTKYQNKTILTQDSITSLIERLLMKTMICSRRRWFSINRNWEVWLKS